jgi:acetylornithine/succinyldiaminopimelate/putrescine aminotransferase
MIPALSGDQLDGIGGLFLVTVVLYDTELMKVLQPGEDGSTFGGHPLARTALRFLIEEEMIKNAAEMGAAFLEADGVRPYCMQVRTKDVLPKDTRQ